MRVEESVDIGRPVEEVFAFATDPKTWSEWAGPVIEVRQPALGQLRQQGGKFATVNKFLGRRFETRYEVTAYEPDRRFSYRSTDGPVPHEETFNFEAVPGGGTRCTQTAEFEAGGFFGLVGPLLQRAAGRQSRNDPRTLKDLIEAKG